MQVYGSGLPPELLATAFPFHIVLDSALNLVQVGSALQRACPTLVVGAPLTQGLRITRPLVEPTLAGIRAQPDALFLLDALDRPLRLRGQMSYSAQEERLYFLGSLWVTSTADLVPLGLTVKDFAIQDPIVDLLVLLQTQRSALADLQQLTAKLSAQRAELRRSNAELAAQAAEQQQLQQEIIQLQAAMLAELSTPLIPLSEHVVVMPLIGTLDTQRSRHILATLLEGVSAQRAQVAIVDITGVPLIDTAVAHSIIQAARAVQLLGARFVLTGIRPEVAQTLVGLGVQLDTLTTYSSLQSAVRTFLEPRAAQRNHADHR